MERKEIDFVFSHFCLDVTSTRRKIRGLLPCGSYQNTKNIIHRSEECKRIFTQAEAFSSTNCVRVLHFLAAAMENPENTIIRVLTEKSVKPQDVGQFALMIAEFKNPSLSEQNKLSKIQKKKEKIKKTIFIVHGRNLAPALTLKGHLNQVLHLEAEMFSDTKKKAGHKTIIEILEQIKNEAAFAFIIVTPEDVGNFKENFDKDKDALFARDKLNRKDVISFIQVLNTRARQNVVFEYGLFMGALGRDRTCCLMQADTKEKPSDLNGLLFEEFTNDISDRFSDVENKLKDPKIRLLKSDSKGQR